MPAVGKVAPSRAGRRQVVCYVAADVLDGVKKAARRRRLTLQQALASAVNDELGRLGCRLRITCERRHLFVRLEKPSQPRIREGERPGRMGRKAIAGWFDRPEVDAVNAFALEVGISVHEMAVRGLRRIADDPEDGEVVSPEPEASRSAFAGLSAEATPLSVEA